METGLGCLHKHSGVVATDGVVVIDTVVEKVLCDGDLEKKEDLK